jgi:hypothetical protein
MENEWTPPSDAVEVKGSSSFVPPSDAAEVVKKKDLTVSGLEEPSSERLTTTTTKATVSSSSKGKPDGVYSFPGQDNAIYKKEGNQWFKASKSDYKYFPLSKGDVQGRIDSLEKNAVSLEQYGFETEPRKEKPLKYTAAPAPAPIAKPKTEAQKREQELFETSFKALEKTDPEYLRRKAQSDAIDAKVNQINADFINDNEEDVVPKVQQLIKDYPYLQVNQSGAGYDELEIVNTITNERKKINLENWTSDRDKEEAKILSGFLDVQMTSKDYVNQYQKVNKIKEQMQSATPTQRIELSQQLLDEQAKLQDLSNGRYNYAKNDKYKSSAIYDKNAKENVKTDFARLQLQSIDYAEKAKSYAEWNQTITEARQKGLITEEQYQNDYLPKLAQEKNMLVDERNKINDDFRQTQYNSTSIDRIAADEFAIQSERGNVLTGATYSALQGAENSLRFLLETGDFQDGEFKGFLTGAAPGSISDFYTSSENRSAFEQIVFGLANSGGSALVGAAAGSPFLGLYASSYVNTKDQMSGPEFKDVPEYQKILFSGALGATVGLLEKYGISKWFSKTPAGKGLTNWVLKKTVAELGKDASSEAIELAVKKNLGSAITNGLIQVTSAGLVEGSTELAQEAADMVYKDVFNKMSDKGQFENPKSWAGVADRLSQSFMLGFAGGAGMQSITQTLQVAAGEMNKAQINNIEQLIDSPELKDTFRLNIKDQILSGQITKQEGQAIAERLNEVEGTLNKIPKNVDRYEAFKLINERDEINREIAGKDPDLVVVQTERVKEINEQLKQLSKDAVQKQTTSEVSVQPGAEISGEMAQGEPEAGPQKVTQEGQQAQEEELKTINDRILEIEAASKRGELLEDSQPGELKRLKDRKKELELTLEAPIIASDIEAKVEVGQINLVSKDNIDEVISKQDTATKQKLAKNAKLALRAIPNAKIYLHNTQSEYDTAVGEETDGTEKGAFIASDGAIHINMQEALPHTLLHEAFHYVILNKGIDGKTLTAWTNSLKSIVKDKDLVDRIEKLTSNYNPEEQSEEFIAELGSIMADAKETLSTSALIKFKALINKIAAKIGLPQIFSAESTTQDAVDFINRIGKQLVTGEEITPGDGGEVGTFTIPKRKLQKAASVSNDPRDFIRELVEDVDLREFNGKKFITNMYDYTNAGETDLGNGFKINMLGGKNYVPLMMSLNNKKIGDVSNLAAFNTKEQAETFIRNAELGGANLFAPHSGTLSQSWQFQQHTFAELFNLVLDSGILTSKELMDVFNNTIKDSEANQAQFNTFAKKYGENIKNFDSFKSDPKKIIDLLDIKNNYSPKLRKALNNAIASNKKFQKAIGVNNKMEFYERIMDPLNQGMIGGEIMNIVDFDPNTFKIVETKPNATDHHPSFGWTLLAKINGIYQPTELYKSVNVTESYTKYNKGGEEISRKAEEPKFEQKNVSSSAGAIPKTAEFQTKRKKQLIGQNAYLTKNVKDNLAVAKKMETAKKSTEDIRVVTGWEKGVDGKWRYEIEDVKVNNRLKDVIANTLKTKTKSTPMYLGDLIDNSTPLLTAYPSLDKAVIIVDIQIKKNNDIQGAYGLIDVDGKNVDVIFLKANKNIDSVESTLIHELQHAIQEREGFAKGTNIKETFGQEIALNRAVKLTEAEQKALDKNISFLSRGIDDVNKMYEYFVEYIKDTLTSEENRNYVIKRLGGEKNLDLANDYVIEYLKENEVPGVRDQKSIIKMFEAKKSFDQVSGNLGYISTAGEVEARNVQARRKLDADAKRKMLLSETEDIPRERQIVDGKIARRKKQIVYNASPKSVEELGKRSGVVYFATDKREADAYAEMNRGKVREFEIPESDISNEQVVLDKINELGLQPKDPQYSIEESLLYELIDDRFDNSLSQGDIKKLFDALKEDGVTAFRYKDGAQVVEGTTESIAVIDNRIIAEKNKKQQKGLSKAQAINAAKDKYDLSVKQRGNTHEQGVESALNDLRKSDWYVESDDIMREEAERELKKFFGQRIKSAPSVGRIMGVKPTKVQVDEAAALKSQLRLEAKAAREAKMDLNAKRKALVSAISAMVKDGKISTRQSKSIINKVGKVNLDNPIMVDRLINYAEKIFLRADYQERLSEASKIRKSIRRALKSKEIQAEVAGMAKMFTKVDPFLVEDIDQYISNAENVLNAIRPVRGLEVAIRQAADIAAINEFITEQIELQEKNKKAELMAVHNYLVESGAITEDMTSKEMQEIIDIINTEESEINDPEKKMNFLKNRFEFMAGIIQKMIVNNEDPFTEESLDLTPRQKELMGQLLKIDMDRLSVKQAALVLEAMDNFMNNGITSGVEAVVKNYQGTLNADRLAASGKKSRPLKMYFNKGIGKLFGEQFVSLPLLIERMFPGMKNGLKLMSDMGLTDVIRGAAKADYEHKQLVKQYTEQGFYKQKDFMNAENVYERGMLAFLSRNLIGTETERRNEFTRRVKIIEESIKELEAGSDAEVKMADLYQKAYDKLKVSERDIDVIKANAEQMNLDAVDWMTNQWASKYDQLADISLSVYNSILGSDTNYTPDRYKGLEGADLELDEDLLSRGSAFMSSLDYTNKNKSGVLIETTRPKNLPKDRFISLDFDTNNFASLKGAMIDIETAPSIRQVDGFLKSDGYKKMVNGDDRKILTSRINNYISAVKGKTNFNRDTLKSVERLANFLGSLGVGKALGGLDQAVKQTTPVIVNTIMNAGRFTPLNMDMNEAINRSGMPIANRGIESITAVESIDSLIDKKSTTAAEAVKIVEKISQMYMKALLSKPDVWVARSSFVTYYQKYLRDNGMDTDIDWKDHEWNKEAMEYAQMMVDRQQNISDEKLAGKFLSSRDPMISVARKVVFPFATFILNQKARMHNDFIALFGSDVSTEDRAKAVKSLGGLAAEMITYQAIAYFIKTMIYDNIAAYIVGDEEEEEKKERSFFGIKMTKKQWNATKFPVKSFVSDLLSPLPLTDDLVTFGFDTMMENFPMITEEEITQSIKDQNDARALKGQEPMNAEQEANFTEKLKQQNIYSVTFKTDGAGRAYGVPGIAFDTYMELAEMGRMATTGEFTEDIGYGPKTKYLTKEGQELVKYMTIPMVLYSTGLVPKDFGTVARKVVSSAKKKAISETKNKNIGLLKEELGRKPNEWEKNLVMNTDKRLTGLVDAIKFAERFGGLTPEQGAEYVKLIEKTGDYDYLNLKRIQDGETADQILKK